MTDAYDQYCAKAGQEDDADLVPTESILDAVEAASNIVFPVLHSGQMPLAIHEREPINKASLLLCSKAGAVAKALRKAMEHLNEEQLEEVEREINR